MVKYKGIQMVLTASTIILIASVLGACGKETTVKEEVVGVEAQQPAPKETTQPKVEAKEKDVLVGDEDMLPPLPTAKEMTEVMKTFESHEEFKGKLSEVGVVEPVASLKDVTLAGNGVKEFRADIHFYEAKDSYFAVYEKEDKLLNDFPESIVQNVWTEEDAKAFINERKNTK